VTKPRVPDSILRNYEAVEAEITKLKVASQTQKLVEKEAETAQKRAIIEAEKISLVEAIELNRSLAQKLSQQRVAEIENEMHAAKARAQADAEFYRVQREAEANRLLLTPEMLQLEAVRALANNTKVYFGDKLPGVFVDTNLLKPSVG